MRVWVPVSRWQVLKSLPLLPVLLADKEGEPVPTDEVLDETVPEYQAPGKKSMLAIWQLDPEDVSLVKYKQALLGPLPPVVGMAWGLDVGGRKQGVGEGGASRVPCGCCFSSDPSLPNVQVTRLTLLSDQAPGPLVMDLTGNPLCRQEPHLWMKTILGLTLCRILLPWVHCHRRHGHHRSLHRHSWGRVLHILEI